MLFTRKQTTLTSGATKFFRTNTLNGTHRAQAFRFARPGPKMTSPLVATIKSVLLMIYYLILSLPGFNILDKIFYGVKQSKYKDVPDKNLFPCDNYNHEYLLIHKCVRIHYASVGLLKKEKPLMIFIHGFPECWYSWRHQLDEFGKDYYVVAIDLRGYNHSSRLPNRTDYSMDKLVCDIHCIVAALSEDCSAVVVGHDWGGAIAYSFAEAHPEMVRRLIVMNMPHPKTLTKALSSSVEQIQKSWYIWHFQLPFVVEKQFMKNCGALVAEMLKKDFVNKDQLTERDLCVFQEAVTRGDGTAIRAMLNYYRNVFTLKSFLAGRKQKKPIKAKTLLIWGEQDKALGIELAHATKQYVEDFTLKTIPNSSHWVQQDTPCEVNKLMREFLQDLPACEPCH